tara:strand:- start:3544 stop:4122 length:579 start_codon:yes stop_codon:yes gene_type:complete
MANNLYKTAFSVGSSEGKYKSTMYDVASSEDLMKLEDIKMQFEQDSFNKTIGSVADTLALASTISGRAEDISDDVSVLEGEYGEMERPEGIFGRMMQSTKMGFGLGEYKFGDEVISSRDIAVKSSQIKYKSMFEEALSDVSPSTNFKSSRNLPSSNTDIDILSNQKLETIDLDKENSNKINFNKPYTMSIIK